MQKENKRELKPIEQCPDGHYYNTAKTGEFCAVCGKKLDPPAQDDLTEEELAEQIYLDEKNWVCGWLVCIRGPNKGYDYKICRGKNFVGSASSMEIQILGDKRIEKTNHAVITYDSKTRQTMLLPGDSRGMVYVKDEAVFEPTLLEPFARIELGESAFLFVAFCGEDVDWEDFK